MMVKIIDMFLVFVCIFFAPVLYVLGRMNNRSRYSRKVMDKIGVSVIRHHYYNPIITEADLRDDLSKPRDVVGLDLNEIVQIELLSKLNFGPELIKYPKNKEAELHYHYHNGTFESGDAELLYSMIRHLKPRHMIEVGSGASTLIAFDAIKKNQEENEHHTTEITCIEPYEQPWLESLGVNVIRERVELCDDTIFSSLEENDILFIDSSHVIRPQGDVVHNILHLIGKVKPGVYIHIHDIFTPNDYLEGFVMGNRYLWDEQYILEAFLCFNTEFEVVLAGNWLHHTHRDALGEACPVLKDEPWREPGSFWIRRKF